MLFSCFFSYLTENQLTENKMQQLQQITKLPWFSMKYRQYKIYDQKLDKLE